jgi:chlorophyllase
MAAPVETMNPSSEVLETTVTSVFHPGKLAVELISVDHNTDPTPPIPVLIAAPKDSGTYPVAMLLHGFCLQNHFYEQVLKHIASFGFIMVAPQVNYYYCLLLLFTSMHINSSEMNKTVMVTATHQMKSYQLSNYDEN